MTVAEQLFAERGYAGTSVRDIVSAADVTQPSLYHFFGSKENLLVELIGDRYQRYCQALDAAIATAESPRDVLEGYVSFVLDRMREQPVSARFVFGTMFGPQHGLPTEALHPVLAEHRGILPRHLHRTAPDVPRRRADFVAMIIQGMVTPGVLHFLSFGAPDLPPEVAAVLAERAEAMLHDELPIFDWPV
jgi:AcrR family transcriptional regulator